MIEAWKMKISNKERAFRYLDTENHDAVPTVYSHFLTRVKNSKRKA